MIDETAKAPPGRGPDDGSPEARDRRARDEAAAWYAKLSGQRASNQEIAEFFDWRSDTLNDAAYTRVEALTSGVRKLADDPRLQALADQAVRRRREGFQLPEWIKALTRPRTGGVLLGALAATVAVGVMLMGAPGQETYRTKVGERRAISLEDGSTIELNTDSQVRVRLGKDQRRLTLDRGQAMFAVAHDAKRPFVVTAGDTSVRAIGTRFEVWLEKDAVRVVLAEGKVQVTKAQPAGAKPAPPVILAAGTRLDVTKAKTTAPVAVDVAAVTGWTQGRLTFKDTRLADAAAEVNRYSRRQVVIAPALADQRFNGVFDTGDIDAFANGVAAALNLSRATRADGTIELTPTAPAPT